MRFIFACRRSAYRGFELVQTLSLPCGARYHRYAKLPLERGNINLNALFRGFIHEIQAQNGIFLYLQYLQSEDEAALQTARVRHEHHRARLTRNQKFPRGTLLLRVRPQRVSTRQVGQRQTAAAQPALGAHDCFSAPVAGVLTAAGQGVEHGRFADVRVARQRHGAPHGCTSI